MSLNTESTSSTECSILVFHKIYSAVYGVMRVRHKLFTSLTNYQEQEKETSKNLKQQRTVKFPFRFFGSVFRSRKHVNRYDLRCIHYVFIYIFIFKT